MQADVRNSVFNDVGGNYTVNNYNIPSPDEEKVLATLKPVVVERRGYDVPGCMEGTRLCLFEEIDIWLNDFGAPNVLWISGSPGAGKSEFLARAQRVTKIPWQVNQLLHPRWSQN